MQFKVSVQSVCIAISAASVSFYAAYHVAVLPISAGGWAGIGFSVFLGVIAALSQTPPTAKALTYTIGRS